MVPYKYCAICHVFRGMHNYDAVLEDLACVYIMIIIIIIVGGQCTLKI